MKNLAIAILICSALLVALASNLPKYELYTSRDGSIIYRFNMASGDLESLATGKWTIDKNVTFGIYQIPNRDRTKEFVN